MRVAHVLSYNKSTIAKIIRKDNSEINLLRLFYSFVGETIKQRVAEEKYQENVETKKTNNNKALFTFIINKNKFQIVR